MQSRIGQLYYAESLNIVCMEILGNVHGVNALQAASTDPPMEIWGRFGELTHLISNHRKCQDVRPLRRLRIPDNCDPNLPEGIPQHPCGV